MKKILITGSEGLIGRILVGSLGDDYELFGLDKVDTSELRKYYQADISNEDELNKAWKLIGPIDVVIHLAGDSFVEAGWEYVLPANIVGAKNIFETARQNEVPKIIFASSGHVVGGYENELLESGGMIDEMAAVRPDGWYGLSKAFGEDLARMYHDQYDMKIYCLRIGAVLESDQPNTDRDKRIWFSHADLIKTVRAMIESDVKFGIYFGVSDNKNRIWDNTKLKDDFNIKFN